MMPSGGSCCHTTLNIALADEVLLASRLLGELAYNLGGDEEVLRRHMASLQSVDQITQMLLVVADLLRLDPDQDYLDRVYLGDMAKRLRLAVAGAS